MAWIELHQTLWQDRKTLLLAGLLGVEDEIAALRVIRLWHWSLDNAEDGDLSGLPSHIIAKASGWSGNADEYLGALVESGFLDQAGECFSIHNWHQYAGKLMDYRKQHGERVKRNRALYGNYELIHEVRERDGSVCRYCGAEVRWHDRRGPLGGTYDHIDPEGENESANIVVACRGCNAKKGRKTPEQAKMRLLPPGGQVDSGKSELNRTYQESANRTVPNHTEPKEAGWPDTKRAREEPAASLIASLELTGEPAALVEKAMEAYPGVLHDLELESWKNQNPGWRRLAPPERARRFAKWLAKAEAFRQQDEARASPNGHSPPPALSTLPDDPEEDALWRQRDEELRAKAHERSRR